MDNEVADLERNRQDQKAKWYPIQHRVLEASCEIRVVSVEGDTRGLFSGKQERFHSC